MSLLAASLATADGIDPAERSGFWIDEGIIPPAEGVLRHVGREVLQNDEIPIENTGTLISLAQRGRVRIDTPHGYLRVTLVGEDLREYLVGEYYPLLMVGRTLTLDGVCRETCLMDAVTPYRLRITLSGAALELETIEGRRAPPVIPPDWSARRERIRATQAEAIVARLNDGIRARGLRWHAGVTGFSIT